MFPLSVAEPPSLDDLPDPTANWFFAREARVYEIPSLWKPLLRSSPVGVLLPPLFTVLSHHAAQLAPYSPLNALQDAAPSAVPAAVAEVDDEDDNDDQVERAESPPPAPSADALSGAVQTFINLVNRVNLRLGPETVTADAQSSAQQQVKVCGSTNTSSPHPYSPQAENMSKRVLHVAGADALVISFHRKCATASSGEVVTLYTDPGMKHAVPGASALYGHPGAKGKNWM